MTIKTLLLAAALATPGLVVASQANAQVNGVGVADFQAAVANTKAWAAARTQIETTYKAQIDQSNARRAALQAELQPMVTKFQAAQAAPGATQASLQPQYQAIQAREASAQQELNRITAPVQRAQAYAIEQISGHMNEAVQAAVRAKNVSLLLRPEAASFAQPAADVTPAITAELDRVVPSVGITPPAGWQPGQNGAAGAAPAATAPAARATPAGRATGR